VATIHLPQMLYIWPYMVFFSFPILIPIALGPLIKRQGFDLLAIWKILPRIWVIILFVIISTAVVHFNTIIHPFILADNRHYVFYVFKILRQSWIIKYLAVPIYVICGWLVINALHYPNNEDKPIPSESGSEKAIIARKNAVQARDHRIGVSIVWLATSSLCLITAPLVEPRYFIVSWVVWRLQIASGVYEDETEQSLQESKERVRQTKSIYNLNPRSRTWLMVETIWFLIVNAVTCYMFLWRTFEWSSQPGVKQRFLW
jgi:alpha-1,2-glucosyltransferase